MSTRKKNADLPRHSKQQETKNEDRQDPRHEVKPDPKPDPKPERQLDLGCRGSESEPIRPSPSMRTLDLTAMLMVGDEHVVINSEEDENVDFMAEFIDP